MDQVEETEFTCPECGSHTFGTSQTDDGSEGMCHGHVENLPQGEPMPGIRPVPPSLGYRPCGFTWKRGAEGDALVFTGTGRFRPAVETAQAVPAEAPPAVDSIE